MDAAAKEPGAGNGESFVHGRSKWILMVSICFNIFVLYSLYAAVIKVFLPNQIADLDPANKVNNLALVYALMSAFTTLATPLSGALSDRARTRWGRRAPFIFLGSLIAALLTVGLSFMTTFWSITVLWVMASFCYNVAQVPMTTLIADRFAPVDRGKASGLLSAGQNIGASIGVVLAGLFVAQIQLGYIVYGAAVFSCCMAFILVNREPSAVERAVEPFRLKSFVTGFWVSPREHPDFAWAFVSRFCMYMGYTLITTYMLYILQDYIGLSKDAANREIGIIFSIQLVGLLSMSIAGGMLSDWMKMRKPFVIAATILISIAYAVPVFEPTVFGLYVYAAIVGVGYGTFTSVDMALMTEVLPKTDDSAGKNLGLLIIALNIPLILGPILAAGILNATSNNYAALFITAATLICVSACMVVPIKSVR